MSRAICAIGIIMFALVVLMPPAGCSRRAATAPTMHEDSWYFTMFGATSKGDKVFPTEAEISKYIADRIEESIGAGDSIRLLSVRITPEKVHSVEADVVEDSGPAGKREKTSPANDPSASPLAVRRCTMTFRFTADSAEQVAEILKQTSRQFGAFGGDVFRTAEQHVETF